ncbi:MAG: hypothetical protein NZM04_07060 [Methylacidiphilales bacterium]|nr:hypothetical protein [Candidatus Methylacidiphilales bacterium]MDW8349274.1 hypothetical protein [Verrucomicrobiae bacterium]
MKIAYHLVHYDIQFLELECLKLIRKWKTEDPWRACHLIVPHETARQQWKRALHGHFAFYLNIEVWTPQELFGYLQRKFDPLSRRPFSLQAWKWLMHGYFEEPLHTIESETLHQGISDLSEAFHQLIFAGHDPRVLEDALPELWRFPYREWCRYFEDRLEERTSASCLRKILELKDSNPRIDHRLILFGFDSSHIDQFPLFAAALKCYTDRAVFTFLPSDVDKQAQRYWLDWADQYLPQARSKIEESDPEEQPLSQGVEEKKKDFIFAINLRQLADQIADWAEEQLKIGFKRIAIVIPDNSSVAGYLSYHFRELKIPFLSTFPIAVPLRFDQQIIASWLRLQKEGLMIPTFLDFWKTVATVPSWQALFQAPLPSSETLHRRLEELWKATGERDLEILRIDMRLPEDQVIMNCVDHWKNLWRWPEKAPLQVYIRELLDQIDTLIGVNIGQEIRAYLVNELHDLSEVLAVPVSKKWAVACFESWLLRPPRVKQQTQEPFVYILRPSEAQGVSWDALLAAEIHEGVWPGAYRINPWLKEERVRSLNEAVSKKNGIFPLPYPSDRFTIDYEHFRQLFNLSKYRLTLAVAFYDEVRGTSTSPSFFFSQAWAETRGEPLDLQSLQREKQKAQAAIDSSRRSLFLEAHLRRRDSTKPFDSYCFCLAKPARPRVYQVRELEDILTKGEEAWYSVFLQCIPKEKEWEWKTFRPLWIGNKMHKWLQEAFSRVMRELRMDPHTLFIQSVHEALKRAAEADKFKLERRYNQAGRPLPYFWDSLYRAMESQARDLSWHLIDGLMTCTVQKIETEKKIEYMGDLSSSQPWGFLSMTGKVDVWVEACDETQQPIILILDYKTGMNVERLTANGLSQGKHFQLLGYAALAYGMKKEIYVGLISRYNPLQKFPIDPRDQLYAEVWRRLKERVYDGRWGYDPRVTPWNVENMPWAHLYLDPNIIRLKAERTRGVGIEQGKFS